MNPLCISMMFRKNKMVLFIVLFIFALMFLCLPQGLIETNEYNDYDSLSKQVVNNNKPVINLRKLFKKLRTFFLKMFKLPQILSNITILVNTRLGLFNMLSSKVLILHLFSVLCSYFNGGKYKLVK